MMPSLFDIVIIALATQRLTAIWIAPLGILTKLREWLATFNWLLHLGVNCGLCVSMWVSAGLYVLWLVGGWWGTTIIAIFAIGSVCSVINTWTRGT